MKIAFEAVKFEHETNQRQREIAEEVSSSTKLHSLLTKKTVCLTG